MLTSEQIEESDIFTNEMGGESNCRTQSLVPRRVTAKKKPVEAQFKTRTSSMYQTCKRRAGGKLRYPLEHFRYALQCKLNANPFCGYCRTTLGIENVSADHRIPVACGGPHLLSNIEFICKGCNKAKGNFTDKEFAALLAVLSALEKDMRNFTIKSTIITALKGHNSFRFGANRRAKR